MSPTTAPRVGQPPPGPGSAPETGHSLPRPRRHSGIDPDGAGKHSLAEPAPGTDDSVSASASFDDPGHDSAHHVDEAGAWTLVRAAQEGDMVAFGELFDRYYDVVFRYVMFRTGDRTLAEDITQETFVRALRRISSVSYQGRDIGAWFITIARNLIFDHVKSSRYRLEQTTSEIIELSPATGGPEQQVLDGATNDELLRCIRKLNPDQQECIQLRFLQGLSVAETAQIMDRNEGAVKALQHRAVRRLAQLLPEGLR
jgi:RNA polymerase sigma-70 factor, ECF subfamily